MKKRHTRMRIWSMFLVCAMLLTMLPLSAAADEPVGERTEVYTPTESTNADEAVTIDLSKGRVEITDEGYKQYEGLTTTVVDEATYTGAYILTGTLELENYSTYKKVAVKIESASNKTFDITLRDVSVLLTHSYTTSSQVYDGLIQVKSGSLNLNVEGMNTLTAKTTGDKNPSSPAIACGSPVIRVMDGDLALTGDGTLTLDNQDFNENRDFSGGIQIHAGSMTVDMSGTLNVHVSNPSASHITCGELDYSDNRNINLPGMDEKNPDHGNLVIKNGTVNLGRETADTLESGTGIIAGRKLEISGGTVTVFSEKASLSAAAPRYSNFGTLIITGADTSVSVKNSISSNDDYRTVTAKENMVVDDGAALNVTAVGKAKGIVVGETQAAEPYVRIGESHITVNTASDCMELFCSLTIGNGAVLDLNSSGANGIHSWVDYNRSNGYPCIIEDANLTISAGSNGIFYQVKNDSSKLEFGNGAVVTIENGKAGIKSSADIVIGGDAQIQMDGSFSNGCIVGSQNIAIKDDAFVKALNSSLKSSIEATGNITVDCAELVVSGLNTAAANGQSITITGMDYVPLNEDIYYNDSMGERNMMYDADDVDTTAQMCGTHSSPYLHVKRAPVVIVPADISIYTGGTGYQGTVDKDGQIVGSASGFPVPGFRITLPDSLLQALEANGDDVSDLVLRETGSTKTWTIEPYDGQAETQIYKLNAGTGQDPVRVQFIDKATGTAVPNDKFDLTTAINEKLEMSLYRNKVGEVTITYNGTIYMVDADGTATLTVRGTTPSAKYGSVKAAETDIPNKAPGVVADEDTVYTINGNSVEVTDKIGILLLFDDIVETNDTGSTTNTALLESRATDELKTSNVLTGQGTRHYESKYLDLVDHNNGNAWVAADRNIQVYWPLPEGTDKNTKFELLHFEGLHREMGVDMVEDQIHTCNVVPMKIDKITDSHIVFTVSSSGFSPFVLAWESTTPVDPGTPDDYTLHYVTNGGEHLSSETKSRPWIKDYEDLPTPVRDGYTFEGWYWDLRLTEPVTGDVNVNKTTVSLYAKWSDNKDYTPDDTGVSNWLETEDHRLFLVGYPDDTFRPERNMTRAEVAQMFYALLLDQDVAITTTFSDVADEAWYATAVKTLASLGMMDGYPDGTFRPDAPITRAEFATVALAFAYDPASASCSYTDVNANAWYYTYVAQATTYGWIGGYPDGTFRPNNSITRAEVAVIVNNMLGRDADERYIDRNADELVHFVDLSKNHWAYYTIMEATNSHDYTKASAGETWKSVR